MPRLDVAPDDQLLVRVIRDPQHFHQLTPRQVGDLLSAADHARLLGWLVSHVLPEPLSSDFPVWLRDRIVSARALVDEYDRSLTWELDRLSRAFDGSGVPWVVLKGAGYLAADLPPGKGRRVADIDVLVPEAQLGDAESLLKRHGWDFPVRDPYDERFYREWMHELPPMVHRQRGSVVDLHHAILPRTSRLHPPSARLFERSREAAHGVRVLCPSHMVLHGAAHLFHDGEIAGAIRDLVDLDGLVRSFDREPTFWPDLVEEAVALDLTRPAYYALRLTERIFGTPVPEPVKRAASAWAPPAPVTLMMDRLVERTVGKPGKVSSLAAFALYTRSHWLRMPPSLLVRHLFRKAFRSPS